MAELAYGIFTDQGDQSEPTEIFVREGMVSGEDYAIFNSHTSYTIKVFETLLSGTVNMTSTYICLGANDGTEYLGPDCQALSP